MPVFHSATVESDSDVYGGISGLHSRSQVLTSCFVVDECLDHGEVWGCIPFRV